MKDQVITSRKGELKSKEDICAKYNILLLKGILQHWARYASMLYTTILSGIFFSPRINICFFSVLDFSNLVFLQCLYILFSVMISDDSRRIFGSRELKYNHWKNYAGCLKISSQVCFDLHLKFRLLFKRFHILT